jgi:hypothetical protein
MILGDRHFRDSAPWLLLPIVAVVRGWLGAAYRNPVGEEQDGSHFRSRRNLSNALTVVWLLGFGRLGYGKPGKKGSRYSDRVSHHVTPLSRLAPPQAAQMVEVAH